MSTVRQISPFDRILYLRSLPQLQQLSSATVTRLAYEAEEVQFDNGEVLYSPETTDPHFYILVSGSVRVERTPESGFEAGPGDTIGFVSMLAGTPRATAAARGEVVALRLPLARVLEGLEEDFLVVQNSIRNLARIQQRLLLKVIGGSRRAPWTKSIPIPRDRDLDLLERLTLIRQGDLFAAVGLEAGVMMATSMQQERRAAGAALWEIDDASGTMCIIVDGEVEAELADGQTFTAGPGYPLGSVESLAGIPRWYRPVARTDIVTFRVDHETFFDVMEDDFGVTEVFLQAMAQGILASIDVLVQRGEPLQVLDPS
ncbi:hypothetical protein DRQ53_00590 [bacterium]|nr:MAG: hypothetical protein DRQ32_02230 [bacterium]RKZ18386.1 MAG: hypothetical protein DRQ53_00590 [bacterium]